MGAAGEEVQGRTDTVGNLQKKCFAEAAERTPLRIGRNSAEQVGGHESLAGHATAQ